MLEIRIKADKDQKYEDFGTEKVASLDEAGIKAKLMKSGLWPALVQRPYGIVARPADTPKAIFISAFSTAPLAACPEYALRDEFENIQTGVNVLQKLTKGGVHMSFNSDNRTVRLHDSSISAVTGLDKPMKLTIVMKGDIIDLCVDNRRCIVNRLPEKKGSQLWFFARNGKLRFENIKVCPITVNASK